MKMDPFIDTAILADQAVQNSARPRDTTLRAMAQKAWGGADQPNNGAGFFSPIGP